MLNFLDQTAADIDEQLQRPLTSHVAEYRAHLAGKGSTLRHVRDAIRRVKILLRLCRGRDAKRVQCFYEISPAGACSARDRLCAARPRRVSIGPATINHYIGALKSFGKWMVDFDRAHRSPFMRLRRMNAALDIRRKRRMLTAEEAGRLVNGTAAKGETISGIPAAERSLMYLLAITTGLRAGELQSLTRHSFPWEKYEGALTCYVLVAARSAKSRKERRVPLRADVAEAVTGYLASVSRDTRLFRRPASHNGTRALQADLAANGVPYCLDGRYADFHALRHTCLSGLARAGAPITVVRDIAGHANVSTTNRYMHTSPDEQRLAVEATPAIRAARVTAGLDRILVDLETVPVVPIVSGQSTPAPAL